MIETKRQLIWSLEQIAGRLSSGRLSTKTIYTEIHLAIGNWIQWFPDVEAVKAVSERLWSGKLDFI